jgi:DNA processing protein
MHHPPLAIYVRSEIRRETGAVSNAGGELPDTIVNGNALAIVGTRRATPDGKATAKSFGRELSTAGFAIVSGLALGIDAAAHEGWLEAHEVGVAQAGGAVAVLAGGLDKFYPSENERLGRRILERGGSIISEYPLGEPPYAPRFLERNRIVCGLARGVLIVECPRRSGSLATAMYAREQNRDLFVVPGPITHPNFFGSHQLIRQGAELVTSPEEILKAYDLSKGVRVAREELAATPEEKQVLLALQAAGAPLDVDKIIELAKLEPRIANQTLTFLLLKHLVKETESGYIIE